MFSSQQRVRLPNIEALLRNMEDSSKAVQIASLKAGTRLAALEEDVEPDTQEKILELVERGLRRHRPEDILGVSYLPEAEVREEIEGILPSKGAIDWIRAHTVFDEVGEAASAGAAHGNP